ncbi:MAG: hypothetical protein ACXWU9_03430 [Telluria sp.]
MNKKMLCAAAFAAMLAGCGDSSPGKLAGTWQAGGIMPFKSTFRAGEMETMGIIEKVGYKAEGNSVIVTMKDGMMKGSAVRYTIVDGRTVQSMGTTYRKVGN